MTSTPSITIIGGGLAGCEAAWQAALRNCRVTLHEMKPQRFSPAHSSPLLAELVCSNSLRASDIESAVGLLKQEMRLLDSLVLRAAAATAVPAGRALAVDRERFAASITETLETHPLVTICRREVKELPPPEQGPTIVATGPLTSAALSSAIATVTGEERLFFYDAIAPIVITDSLDHAVVYRKSRYDDGPGDYLNCPMDRDQYRHFIDELARAEYVPLHPFEEPKYFDGCLPIEVLCARGEDTLRFGPMKPVGLADPRTGHEPYAVVQLRQENREGTTCNMVGFQTKLTYREQQRIFHLIPGMERAEFARLGSIHRNTFICAPLLLQPTLQLKARPDLFFAGQLAGVEGYVESAAMGLVAGINAARLAAGATTPPPPPETALGALISHLTASDPNHFQPSNVNFGLFPAWGKKPPKRLRGRLRAETAVAALQRWRQCFTGNE